MDNPMCSDMLSRLASVAQAFQCPCQGMFGFGLASASCKLRRNASASLRSSSETPARKGTCPAWQTTSSEAICREQRTSGVACVYKPVAEASSLTMPPLVMALAAFIAFMALVLHGSPIAERARGQRSTSWHSWGMSAAEKLWSIVGMHETDQRRSPARWQKMWKPVMQKQTYRQACLEPLPDLMPHLACLSSLDLKIFNDLDVQANMQHGRDLYMASPRLS